MSVEFELQRRSLRPVRMPDLVRAWRAGSSQHAEVLHQTDDAAELFLVGTSIRGFSVRRRWAWFRNQLDVRLSVCASPEDWQAAYSFLRFARDRGFAAIAEDGLPVDAEDLSDDAAMQRGATQFVADVHFLQRLIADSDDEGVDLPNARFAVNVRPGDIPSGPITASSTAPLRDALQQRAAKYAAARSAGVITIQSGRTAIVWSGEALLAPVADFVVLPRAAVEPVPYGYLPWEHTILELGDAVERAQRNPARLYFSVIAADDARWRRLVAAAEPIEQLEPRAG